MEKKNDDKDMKRIDYSEYQSFNDFAIIIPEFLFLCDLFAAKDLKQLEEFGITHMVTCVKLAEPFHDEEKICTLIVPVDDRNNENIMKYFPQVVEFIEAAKKTNGRVLVHCHAGVSRSSSFVICYLMYTSNMDFESCFQLVKGLKPNINPNESFRDQLRRWESTTEKERLTEEYKKHKRKHMKKNGYCKNCGLRIFSEILRHDYVINQDNDDDEEDEELKEEESEGEDDETEKERCESIYISELLCTFEIGVENEEIVIITCRKCRHRIGNFVAEGERCDCDQEIQESSYKIDRSKIKFCREKKDE